MPRKPRTATARRSTTSRDVPGALYCDPGYGQDPGAAHDGGGGTGADGEDGDGGEDTPDGRYAAPGGDREPDDILSEVRGWIPLTARPKRRRVCRSPVPPERVTQAIEDARGNVAVAARALGLRKEGVYRRIASGAVQWPEGTPRVTRGQDEWVGSGRIPAAEVWAAWERLGNVERAAEASGVLLRTMHNFLRRRGVYVRPPKAPVVPLPTTPHTGTGDGAGECGGGAPDDATGAPPEG